MSKCRIRIKFREDKDRIKEAMFEENMLIVQIKQI